MNSCVYTQTNQSTNTITIPMMVFGLVFRWCSSRPFHACEYPLDNSKTHLNSSLEIFIMKRIKCFSFFSLVSSDSKPSLFWYSWRACEREKYFRLIKSSRDSFFPSLNIFYAFLKWRRGGGEAGRFFWSRCKLCRNKNIKKTEFVPRQCSYAAAFNPHLSPFSSALN